MFYLLRSNVPYYLCSAQPPLTNMTYIFFNSRSCTIVNVRSFVLILTRLGNNGSELKNKCVGGLSLRSFCQNFCVIPMRRLLFMFLFSTSAVMLTQGSPWTWKNGSIDAKVGFQASSCVTLVTLTASSASLSLGTKPYSPNTNCAWIIAPFRATKIMLTFSSFQTEYSYDT
jgi:hypothetical protein